MRREDVPREKVRKVFEKEIVMAEVADRPDVRTLDNFIGGRWVASHASEFFDVHNPAVGDVIGRTPLSTAADVDAAGCCPAPAVSSLGGKTGDAPPPGLFQI